MLNLGVHEKTNTECAVNFCERLVLIENQVVLQHVSSANTCMSPRRHRSFHSSQTQVTLLAMLAQADTKICLSCESNYDVAKSVTKGAQG
jgi:hypothetical protein